MRHDRIDLCEINSKHIMCEWYVKCMNMNFEYVQFGIEYEMRMNSENQKKIKIHHTYYLQRGIQQSSGVEKKCKLN